jgi:hypothetical protein
VDPTTGAITEIAPDLRMTTHACDPRPDWPRKGV